MIKIIAGKYRGRNIETPETDSTRPTKSMTREAVFSAIGKNIENAAVLDLFGGSGAYSIESLSRGAAISYINDLGKEANKVIKNNFIKLNENNYKLTQLDYKEALTLYKEVFFNIVFLDPPYALDIYDEVLSFMISNNMINNYSIAVLETNKDLNLEKFSDLFNLKKYKYGYTIIYILKGKDV